MSNSENSGKSYIRGVFLTVQRIPNPKYIPISYARNIFHANSSGDVKTMHTHNTRCWYIYIYCVGKGAKAIAYTFLSFFNII